MKNPIKALTRKFRNLAAPGRRRNAECALPHGRPGSSGALISYITGNDEGRTVAPPSKTVDEYEIERILGWGGSGVTYLARNSRLDRQEALKMYRPAGMAVRRTDMIPNETYVSYGAITGGPSLLVSDRGYDLGLAYFRDEARALVRFDQPHIVGVYRTFVAHQRNFFAMEYVEGRTLAEELAEKGPLPEPRVRAILRALSDGLSAVHAERLLHRDVKPQNVMLRAPLGTPVLIDFGAVRHVMRWQQVRELRASDAHRSSRRTHHVLTPGYAPIEQYQFSDEDHQGPWTDLYALGALAYEALSGYVPHDATSRWEEDRLPPVSEFAAHPVSAELATAIDTALAVEPVGRPRTVNEWRKLWGG